MLRINDEPEYNSFLHLFGPEKVKTIKFLGQAEVNFIGFGPKDMTAAPEVGYNLTYVCPEGQVFDHDWFATPFVTMMCQVKHLKVTKQDQKSNRSDRQFPKF